VDLRQVHLRSGQRLRIFAPDTATYALVFERGWWDETADVTLTVLRRLIQPPITFPPLPPS
jgi:hypothetical protein